MLGVLLRHQWKAATRSSVWQRNLVLNIILGLLMLYLLLNVLAIGYFLPQILEAVAPGKNVISLFHRGFVYYLGIDLVLRFFLQELPVLAVQPYLHLPIRKSRLLHFMLNKSLVSVFNLLPLFIFIPFAVQVISPEYGPLLAVFWVLTIFCLLLINNFVLLFLKRQLVLKPVVVVIFAALLAGLAYLESRNIIALGQVSEQCFNQLLHQPLFLLIPVLFLAGAYAVNYALLRRNLYIQEPENATASVSRQEFAFLQQWGEAGKLLALEFKLIWRNKRPRTIFLMSFFMLPYGLVFFRNHAFNVNSPMLFFASTLVTGACMFYYGQFLHSWEGGYYDCLMTRNINAYQYYRSKFLLLAGMCTLFFVLSIPYVLMGWQVLAVLFASYLYNAGVNTFVILYLAIYNPKRVDLSKSSAFNYQGVGGTQFLLVLPLMLGPVLVCLVFWWLGGLKLGMLALAVLGLTGMAFHKQLLQKLAKRLALRKYKVIAGFRAS